MKKSSIREYVRLQLETAILEHFDDADEFVAFLVSSGYGAVTEIIPRSSDEIYLEQLLMALDRRSLLDQTFFEALVVEKPVLREDLSDTLVQLGVELPDHHGALVAESDLGLLPPDVLERITEAVEQIDDDSARFIVSNAPFSQLHPPANRAPEPVPRLIHRLSLAEAPDDAEALRWFMSELADHAMDDRGDALRDGLGQLDRLLGTTRPSADETLESIDVPAKPPLLPGPSLRLHHLAAGLEAARSVVVVGLGPSQRRGGCTGWLLTPSLIVTPAHLLRTPPGSDEEGLDLEAVLDFDDDEAVVRHVPVTGVELLDDKLDLALLRLTEKLVDRRPLRLNPFPPNPENPSAERIALIHHPQLQPKRISMYGCRVLDNDGQDLLYAADSAPGSGGAPLLDEQWQVIATHRAVKNRARMTKLGTSTQALLAWLRGVGRSNRALWDEVVAAQPDLKNIDPSLRQILGDERRAPMLIRTLEPQHEFDDVPDLMVSSVLDRTISATGSIATLEALIEDPHVLSVEASHRAGIAECFRSVAHVRATEVHEQSPALAVGERGDDALVAVVDNGVDVLHEAFLDGQGKTRIRAFWDQKDLGAPADDPGTQWARSFSDATKQLVRQLGLRYGALYSAEDIQQMVDTDWRPATFPPRRAMGHGTRVCSIAAGCRTGTEPHHFPGGVAPEAGLIVVRYDLRDASVGYSMGHVDALGFIDQLAGDSPVVVNISNGMNAGAHDGTSTVEDTCEQFCSSGSRPGRAIVKSAGNERGQGHHALLDVPLGGVRVLRWTSALKQNGRPGQPDLMELWFESSDRYAFRVRFEEQAFTPWIDADFPTLDELLPNGNRVRAALDSYVSDNGQSRLRVEVLPGDQAEVEAGQWAMEIEGRQVIADEGIHAWVELSIGRKTHFTTDHDDNTTVTIPGTARHVLCVGAVEVGQVMRLHERSSFGPTRGGLEKPDLVAPGVHIRAAKSTSQNAADPAPPAGSDLYSGTSFAAPHVAGAIALLFSQRAKQIRSDPALRQWNVRQIMSALRTQVKHWNGRWNEGTGFGELDVKKLLDALR